MPKVKNPNIAKTATKWGQTGSKTGSKNPKKSSQSKLNYPPY